MKTFLETLQKAQKSVARERHYRLTAIELTSAQAQILTVLQQLGPISLNDLANELPTDSPPSRVVSTLVDRKLVLRRDDTGDRRFVELELSARGKKKVIGIRRVDQAIQRWAARKMQKMPVQTANKALTALAKDD